MGDDLLWLLLLQEYHRSVEGERSRLEKRKEILRAQERQLDEAFQVRWKALQPARNLTAIVEEPTRRSKAPHKRCTNEVLKIEHVHHAQRLG